MSSVSDVWSMFLNENIVPIRQRDATIPKPLAAVLDQSLAITPKDRFQNAAEPLTAVRKALS